MLQMRPNCECCDADLPPDAPAFICSFECTWCPRCTAAMSHQCPNCGGALSPRPTRAAHLLAKNPPSTQRVLKAGCAHVRAGT